MKELLIEIVEELEDTQADLSYDAICYREDLVARIKAEIVRLEKEVNQ